MELQIIDWIIVAVYLSLTVYIGFRLKGDADKNLTGFFLGGRNLPWYVVGISMVATTFAADTPLWVTEKIAQYGVSGNWIWWNMLIGGTLTTFFFSKLWHRADIITELEFIELRYSGKAAAFLRGFKSVYMGIFLNMVIIGWVNFALMTILQVFFDIPESEALWYVTGAMVLVALYSTLAGLKGVAVTDNIQFIIAMAGCIILAIIALNHEKIGGISGLKEKLPAWRFDFFPNIGKGGNATDTFKVYSLSIGAFLTFGLVQWWASWYPGAEPGGGGYIAQRMMSAKNEKHSLMATLFFQIAHYCLRPWPWIIVGLCSLVLYPNLDAADAGKGFVYIMRDLLPVGLKGLLLVAFLSAYMSTISTQLNWGASYLVNDLYKRFIRPEQRFSSKEVSEKHYVLIARSCTVLIMLFAFFSTLQISTIDSAAQFLISCGAGLGMVLILRWYWWRINAWSEIAASVAPFLGYSLSHYVFNLEEYQSFLFTVGTTSIIWISVTFLSAPTKSDTLLAFYNKVRPGGMWKKVYQEAGIESTGARSSMLFLCWISSIVMIYSILFLIGKLIFQEWQSAGIWLFFALLGFYLLRLGLKKSDL